MKPFRFELARAARAAAVAAFALSTLFLPADAAAAGKAAPPRPRAGAGGLITAVEARALADWALARPEVAARFKGARTRLIHAGYTDAAKDGKAASGARAVLSFRNYEAGGVQQIVIDLVSGAVEMGDVARNVQPRPEEIAEGTAIVLRDAPLAPLAADPSLTLMGGFRVLSPHADDPCAREVCLEFVFMEPGFADPPRANAKPPRRIIVNLTRGAVVNRDYKSPSPANPALRMTAAGDQR